MGESECAGLPNHTGFKQGLHSSAECRMPVAGATNRGFCFVSGQMNRWDEKIKTPVGSGGSGDTLVNVAHGGTRTGRGH
jgi:hypothetical protein